MATLAPTGSLLVPAYHLDIIRNRFIEANGHLGGLFLKVRGNPLHNHLAELLNIPSGRPDSGKGIKEGANICWNAVLMQYLDEVFLAWVRAPFKGGIQLFGPWREEHGLLDITNRKLRLYG